MKAVRLSSAQRTATVLSLKTGKRRSSHSPPETVRVPTGHAPTQKEGCILPSPYLVAGDWGRRDFFRASNQCLKRLVCFFFLLRKAEEGGRRLEANRAPPRSMSPGSNAASQDHSKVSTTWPLGTCTALSLFPSNVTPHRGEGLRSPYRWNVAMKELQGEAVLRCHLRMAGTTGSSYPHGA